MKTTLKFWMLLVVVLSIVSCTDNNDYPTHTAYATLEEALASNALFSTIEENPDPITMKKKETGYLTYQSQYSMFFHQAVNHNQPDGDTFQQRVCILFRGFDRPTILVTEGYEWRRFGDAEDIGMNLNANMVHVEHRNFGKSYNQDQGKWEYETGAQASADLHAVYQALKSIFKGKWMSTGTSKNGETSMDYAYYYPNDMDLAAAFCSPFIVSLDDKCFGEYLFNEASTEEVRDLMKKSIRSALENGEEGLYQQVCKLFEQNNKPVPSFTEYVFNIFDSFFTLFQYTLPSEVQGNLVLTWNQHQEGDEAAKYAEQFANTICESILSNRSMAHYTYRVDCAKEQGFPNPGYDYFADLLEGTSFKAEDVWKFLLNEEDQWLPQYYDNSLRLDMRENFFMNSTMPLLFFYSHDDPWSAAQPDKLGPNAKKVINPIGIHCPIINETEYCPEDVKQEVMDFISTYIY